VKRLLYTQKLFTFGIGKSRVCHCFGTDDQPTVTMEFVELDT